MWAITIHGQPRNVEGEVAVTFDDMLHEEDQLTTMAGFQTLVRLCLRVAAGLHAMEGAAAVSTRFYHSKHSHGCEEAASGFPWPATSG